LLSIYGFNRPTLDCDSSGDSKKCIYKKSADFLADMDVGGAKFWVDFLVLTAMFVILRVIAYFVLRWKVTSDR
jgi:hypothetical protein